jgi:hypothetical protein
LNLNLKTKKKQYHNQGKMYEKSLKYLNMGFTGMFSVETVLKIIGFGVKVGVNFKKLSTKKMTSTENYDSVYVCSNANILNIIILSKRLSEKKNYIAHIVTYEKHIILAVYLFI